MQEKLEKMFPIIDLKKNYSLPHRHRPFPKVLLKTSYLSSEAKERFLYPDPQILLWNVHGNKSIQVLWNKQLQGIQHLLESMDLLKKTRKWPFPGFKLFFFRFKPGIQLLITRFFIFRTGPGFQIWVSNLRFTSYFNSSFDLFLSNCWF